jgi:cation:H+ antiporter
MSKRTLFPIILTICVALPAVYSRVTHAGFAALANLFIFGAAVVASAFILAWAAEAAQVDISAGLATAILALIAVLPEYAVDLYFAFTSGSHPEFAPYAAANMTGSNRLLVGLGWPLVALVFAWSRRRNGGGPATVELEPNRRIELAFLATAGIFAFIIPLFRRISIFDAAVLLILFGLYVFRTSKEERSEPELDGIPEAIASLPKKLRRVLVASLFLAAATMVLVAAEPFANALVASGKQFGIDEFLLIQWLAPLASEAPELIVAVLLAWKGRGSFAIGTLLSSKVNQWTLLVGSLPIAHLVGGGGTSLPLDPRQVEEFLLTATQTMLGVAVIANLRFRPREAVFLLVLFLSQLVFPGREVRLAFAALYAVAAIVLLIRARASVRAMFRQLFGLPVAA